MIYFRSLQAFVLASALALGACVDTVGTQSTITPAKSKPGQPPIGGGTMSVEQVQKKLQEQCVTDSGDFVGLNATIKKNCECYSNSMSKAMGKDDLAFYASYSVIPTLGNLKPDDAKRKCGIVPDADKPSRARGKLPAPPN